MKSILIVSYRFPPMLTAESIQTGRCAKYLDKQGWNVSVLTASKYLTIGKKDDSLVDIIPKSIKINRSLSIESKIYKFYSKRLQPFALTAVPDDKHVWSMTSIRLGKKLLKKNSFNVICSRSSPPRSHIVALELAKHSGIPWVACFSDPWSNFPLAKDMGPKFRNAQIELEKLVVKQATFLVFTTKNVMDMVLEQHIEDNGKSLLNKSFVIPNSFDPELIICQKKNLKNKTNNKVKIIHAGNFYGARQPTYFLKAWSSLLASAPSLKNEVEITFVGDIDANVKKLISSLNLRDTVKFTGIVPYFESLSYLAEADALLIIDAPLELPSPFLPSKLVEYMAFRKPIFALTPKKGITADVLSKYGGCVSSPNDVKEISINFKKFIIMLSNQDNFQINFDDFINEYRADIVNKKLSDILDKIIKYSN